MQLARSLPATRYVLPRWFIPWAGVNLGLVAYHVVFRWHGTSYDWELWRALPDAIAQGRLYDIEGIRLWYAWSPVMAPFMALVGIMGWIPWLLIHFVSLAFLRNWLLILAVAISWGFWVDLFAGNTFTFVVVAGIPAVGGSKPAALVYIGLCVLMPRPVQMPLAVWLAWTMPSIRIPGLALFVVHAFAVLATGYAIEWMAIARQTVSVDWNMHPLSAFGAWWLVVGVPLGLYLLWKGRPGWSGLAVSTYWVPTYLMMPLVDLSKHSRGRVGQRAEQRNQKGQTEPDPSLPPLEPA